jgi:hypothetical protein
MGPREGPGAEQVLQADGADRLERWRGALRVAGVVLATAPLLWFASRAWSRRAYPVFDDALIALRIHDVLSAHPPTLGAGTSFGRIAIEARANHPGPLPFYLLAPVWGLTGFRPGGLVLSLLLYHVAFVVLIAVLAWRLGGDRLLVLTLAVVLLLERSFGVDLFTRVFNPYLGVLPFLASVLACWAAMARSPWYLAVAVFAGSVAAQAQLGFGPPAVVLIGVAALACAASAVRTGGRGGVRPLVRPGAVTVAVGLACWAAPLWQELTTEHGNLSRLWSSLDRPGATLGLAPGFAVAWQLLGHLPPRLARFNPFPARDWLDPDVAPEHLLRGAGVVAALVVLLVVLVRRRRSPLAVWGLVLALVGVALTVALVPMAPAGSSRETYQFLWVWVFDALLLLAVGVAAFELVPPLPRRLPLAAAPAAAAVVLVALAVTALPATYTPQTAYLEDEHRPAIRATRRALRDDPGPYLLSCLGAARSSFCASLTLALETDGVATRQHPRETFLWGPDQDWRRADGDEVLPGLVAYHGPDVVAPVPGARLVYGPADTAEGAADVEAAVEELSEEPVVVEGRDVDRLNAARFEARARLAVRTPTSWFVGETAREWNDLIRSDPERFVRGGGLPVLDAAGLLAGRPALAAVAERWQQREHRDAVWLTPPTPPREHFPRAPPG